MGPQEQLTDVNDKCLLKKALIVQVKTTINVQSPGP